MKELGIIYLRFQRFPRFLSFRFVAFLFIICFFKITFFSIFQYFNIGNFCIFYIGFIYTKIYKIYLYENVCNLEKVLKKYFFFIITADQRNKIKTNLLTADHLLPETLLLSQLLYFHLYYLFVFVFFEWIDEWFFFISSFLNFAFF